MYRIFCESYQNYLNSFDKENSRLKIAEPLELLTNIEKFPKLKAFLWTLNSREIKAKKYHVAKLEELEERTKLVNSFLKLAYWY